MNTIFKIWVLYLFVIQTKWRGTEKSQTLGYSNDLDRVKKTHGF